MNTNTNTLTIATFILMMTDDYVPIHQTPRAFTKTRKKGHCFKSNREPYNVNKQARRRHSIKQPGYDVQRRTLK